MHMCQSLSLFDRALKGGAGPRRDRLDHFIARPPPFGAVRLLPGDDGASIPPAGEDQRTDPHHTGEAHQFVLPDADVRAIASDDRVYSFDRPAFIPERAG